MHPYIRRISNYKIHFAVISMFQQRITVQNIPFYAGQPERTCHKVKIFDTTKICFLVNFYTMNICLQLFLK